MSSEPSQVKGQINSVVGTAEQLAGAAVEAVVSDPASSMIPLMLDKADNATSHLSFPASLYRLPHLTFTPS